MLAGSRWTSYITSKKLCMARSNPVCMIASFDCLNPCWWLELMIYCISPVITQCSMRHLYTAEPRVPDLIEQAKTYERRRCDHHTLEEPLSTLECLKSVVDPKGSGTNKHRYIVATQSAEVRAALRAVPGVPLIYIHRSVMILEPMASVTENARERNERSKFRLMLKDKKQPLKRKRDGESSAEASKEDAQNGTEVRPDEEEVNNKKKKKQRGPKGPNPLSVKKAKKRVRVEESSGVAERGGSLGDMADGEEAPARKKRRRRHGSHVAGHETAQMQEGPSEAASV